MRHVPGTSSGSLAACWAGTTASSITRSASAAMHEGSRPERSINRSWDSTPHAAVWLSARVKRYRTRPRMRLREVSRISDAGGDVFRRMTRKFM